MKKNYTYAIITVFIWSTLAALVKKMLFDIPNLEALSVSSFFAFLFLLLVNIKRGSIKEMKKYSARDYGIMGVVVLPTLLIVPYFVYY